jgi:hypothetical protein
MRALLGAFWQIVLFRRGPDSLPDSGLLLLLSLAAYVAVDVLVIAALYPSDVLLPLLLIDTGCLALWCAALLAWFGYARRIRQTLTALLGTGALLQLLVFPLTAWPSFGIDFEIPLALRQLGALLTLLWSVAVYGYIVAAALERSPGVGVAFAVAYFLVIYQLAAWLGSV